MIENVQHGRCLAHVVQVHRVIHIVLREIRNANERKSAVAKDDSERDATKGNSAE